MNYFRFSLMLLAVFCAVDILTATKIQNKLDDYVLMVINERVPPLGPNARLGVKMSPLSNNSLEQEWDIENEAYPQLTRIFPQNITVFDNSITRGLRDENATTYLHHYDSTNITENKYGLLRLNDMSFPKACIKNPGFRNGGFHLEVECNYNDDAQLWRFVE